MKTTTTTSKPKRIPNLKVEIVAFFLLSMILGMLMYLILNYTALVEFRELD